MSNHWNGVREEATRYLQDLVRIDTTNPPGNETQAAEYLAGILRREGIEAHVLESAPGRGNLVARLPGDGRAAPLLLMSHLDVVPAEPQQWTHAPFGGDLQQGYVWGRGSLDTKDLAVMELMVLLLLKRQGDLLARDIVLMANADEEAGGKLGAGWMVREHPDLIRSEYAINEGGGFALDILGEKFYACQVAEKGTARFLMRACGRPGHGSQPNRDNAVLKLAEAIAAVGAADLPVHPTNTVRLFIEAIVARVDRCYAADLMALLDPRQHARAVARLPVDEGLRLMFYAMLHNTVTPTMLNAGTKINVIPSSAEVRCDARVLPGQTSRDLLNELRPALGKDLQIEFLDDTPAREMDFQTPLYEMIRRVMQRYDSRATVVPYLVVGATDARHVHKLGTKVYGFTPMCAPSAELDRVHGNDERISVESLAFGTRVLHEIVSEFCAGS